MKTCPVTQTPAAEFTPEGPFTASPMFKGARKGFVFKTGDRGLGYYVDAQEAGGTGELAGSIPSHRHDSNMFQMQYKSRI